MANALIDRLHKRRSVMIKKGVAAATDNVGRSVESTQHSLERLHQHAREFLEVAEGTDRNRRRAFQNMESSLMHNVSAITHLARGDTEKARLAFARNCSQLFALHDFSMSHDGFPNVLRHENMADFLMSLFAIGWAQEAEEYCKSLWTSEIAFANPKGAELLSNELYAWFTLYFTLGSRDLIAATGVKEPDAPDSVYSKLLGTWREEDPEKVCNVLIAYSEHNLAQALLPESKQPLDQFRPDKLFIPFDVLAINMRRQSLGLAWVETGDPRLEDLWPVSREEMPLVKDDVIWPVYTALCERLGVEPYRGRAEVEVKTCPNTLEILEY